MSIYGGSCSPECVEVFWYRFLSRCLSDVPDDAVRGFRYNPDTHECDCDLHCDVPAARRKFYITGMIILMGRGGSEVIHH